MLNCPTNQNNESGEPQLRKQIQALELKVRELESFSYAVSHDLHAPIRLIHAFSERLLSEYGENLADEVRIVLQRIGGGDEKAGGLIDSLLQYAHGGSSDMSHMPVDLTALATEAMIDIEERAPRTGVTVTVAEGLHAHGDRRLLRMALDNLLGNAWKYTGRLTHAHIEFGIAERCGRAEFFIRDNGAGFNMERASRLFNPCQRLHAAHEFPGSGLGLAIVRRIIERHGGYIRAESTPGRGATFYFTLSGS